MPVATDHKVAKAPTLAQRTTQAVSRIQALAERGDSKILSAAVLEAAASQAELNANFLRAIQILYDAIAATTRPAAPRRGAGKPKRELIPIVSGGEVVIGRDDEPDAYVLQRLYGNEQLRDALDNYTLATLKAMAQKVMARNPGTAPQSVRTKAGIVDYIVARLTAS